MPRHLFLPKQSLKDVRTLLRLDEDKLRALEQLLGTEESINPRDHGFVQKVAEQLRLEPEVATSVSLVGQFLLTVVEEGQGNPPDEVIDDVRYFLEQNAGEDKTLLASFDAKRKLLVSLVTPKPERSRALKVRYLLNIFPTVASFRTVCELRPVFWRSDGDGERDDIVGFVPAVLLEVKQSDVDGNESQQVLHLTPATLQSLAEVVKRTEAKLDTIRRRFEGNLLGDATKE